ncbi:MAG: TonB-dependent receptor [Bryobacteraceae bacterium]|nr:TonB-dependent receptor [Bryobacteraceae bacterium]
MIRSTRRFHHIVAIGLALIAFPIDAQVDQGLISGSVADSTGARIAGAQVVITNLGTNISSTTVCDSNGNYRSVPLQVGTYAVRVQHSGFKVFLQRGITLSVRQEAVVNVALEIGAVAESVEVNADVARIQTADASRGEVIENKQIVELPLNGRNYVSLGLLTAGTNVPPPGSRSGGFSAGGLRAGENNYLLDGLDNNNNQQVTDARSAQVVAPSVDAIQEFRVQTSNYSAEFGRNVGAVINVVLKSGTNEFHGGAFEFLRNEKFDARNFFDRPNSAKAPYKQNQFGGLLGGPIQRDRMFFFADYEATRLRTARPVVSSVPTTLERGGDFSQSILAGQAVQIFDPFSYDSTTQRRQPFAGNIIPASRLDPVGAKAVAFYPDPNGSGFANNFIYNPRERTDVDRFDVKLDRQFTANDLFNVRYSRHQFDINPEGELPAPAYGGSEASTISLNTGKSVAGTYSHVFTPSLFNTFKLGWNSLDSIRSLPTGENLNALIGLRGAAESAGMSQFAITGYRSLGTQPVAPKVAISRTTQLLNDLSWYKGRHSFKAGVSLTFIALPLTHFSQARGSFSFNGNFTRDSSTQRFGHPVADALTGIPFNTNLSTTAQANQRRNLFHAYVNDQIKWNSRLTLTLGLRWEFTGPLWEKQNGYSNVDTDITSGPPVFVIAKDGSLADRATVTPQYANFAPRAGIAFQATKRTIIRTGYGIYFGGVNSIFANPSENPPFYFLSSFATDSVTPEILLRNGFPEGATRQRVTNLSLSSWSRENITPYAQQWNFTLERQIATSLVVEAGYAGTKGNNLVQLYDANSPLPGPGNINARRPVSRLTVPGLTYEVSPMSSIFRREFRANSNYHSLQLKATKRLAAGLSFIGSYVWSKTMSDGRGGDDSGGTSSRDPQNPRDLRAERAIADEHVPHRFVFSYTYDLPFGRGRRFGSSINRLTEVVLGGWALNGITSLSAGRPVSPSVAGNPSNTGTPNRPDATGISPSLPDDQRTIAQWFNPAAFVANRAFTFGNSARNVLTSPGTTNFDFGLHKSLPLWSDRFRLQVRGEFFNLFNTPQFGSPNATVGTNGFAAITTASPGRIVQLGMKLNF